mmetsp:Transcript_35665/g.102757  ORF Transcript_35665/g.102757 Transcript_35665/m.102757 type:complete len:216 (-) Transcript_35665:67-714(-)
MLGALLGIGRCPSSAADVGKPGGGVSSVGGTGSASCSGCCCHSNSSCRDLSTGWCCRDSGTPSGCCTLSGSCAAGEGPIDHFLSSSCRSLGAVNTCGGCSRPWENNAGVHNASAAAAASGGPSRAGNGSDIENSMPPPCPERRPKGAGETGRGSDIEASIRSSECSRTALARTTVVVGRCCATKAAGAVSDLATAGALAGAEASASAAPVGARPN